LVFQFDKKRRRNISCLLSFDKVHCLKKSYDVVDRCDKKFRAKFSHHFRLGSTRQGQANSIILLWSKTKRKNLKYIFIQNEKHLFFLLFQRVQEVSKIMPKNDCKSIMLKIRQETKNDWNQCDAQFPKTLVWMLELKCFSS